MAKLVIIGGPNLIAVAKQIGGSGMFHHLIAHIIFRFGNVCQISLLGNPSAREKEKISRKPVNGLIRFISHKGIAAV